MIREFRAESSSQQTASSANESRVSEILRRTDRNPRADALFCALKGTGEEQNRACTLILRRDFSVRQFDGAPARSHSAVLPFARTSPFREEEREFKSGSLVSRPSARWKIVSSSCRPEIRNEVWKFESHSVCPRVPDDLRSSHSLANLAHCPAAFVRS